MVVMVFALVGMSGVLAANYRPLSAQLLSAAIPRPTPPAKSATASAKAETGEIVGTCNTVRGCEALKGACKTLKKHSFKVIEADGSTGVCYDQATATFFLRNSNTPGPATKDPTTGQNEAANKEVTQQQSGTGAGAGKIKFNEFTIKKTSDAATPTLQCEGVVLCRKVKDICATLGGTYKRINDLQGTCRH